MEVVEMQTIFVARLSRVVRVAGKALVKRLGVRTSEEADSGMPQCAAKALYKTCGQLCTACANITAACSCTT